MASTSTTVNGNGPTINANSGDAMVTNGASDDKRVKAAIPLHKRLLYGLAVHSLQRIIVGPAMFARRLHGHFFPAETHPTTIKTYSCRPGLPVRIFFPKSYNHNDNSPSSAKKLPVLLSIHGGGFVVGDPSDNDPWNSIFANEHTAMVVALNYGKAPSNAYPGPRLDLEAQIAAVFDDPVLAPHMNLAKVGILGFSAGGNLATTVSTSPQVRDRITAGCVPIYPVVDLSLTSAEKASTRRYKPTLPGDRGANKDFLLPMAALFDWSYVSIGQDLRDPILSPYFAERKDFPRRMWFIGCELDLLGHEAWRMACKLSGRAIPAMDDPIGQQDVVEDGKLGCLVTQGDERYSFEVKDSSGEVKWLLVPDAGHGFDMAAEMRKDEETILDGKLKRDALIKLTGKWLYRDTN